MKAQENADVGRASFTPAEIAARNSLSLTLVYRALRVGTLKGSNLGAGLRGGIRVTPKQESEWLELCQKTTGADNDEN